MANKDASTDKKGPEKDYVQTYGKDDENEDYGYFFFPNREKGKVGHQDFRLWSGFSEMIQGNRKDKMLKCLMNKERCIRSSGKVKLLLRALEAHGCPIDINKHIQCERCHWRAAGGFDHFTNQLVLCENNVSQRSNEACCQVMAHELLHAFDKCRAKMDITKVEHMACTEIRASNLLGCSRISSIMHKDGTFYNLTDVQKKCVEREAMTSVLMGRNIDEPGALEVISKVFTQCYNDLEPFGRRIRGRKDEEIALRDGLIYGYMPSKVEKEAERLFKQNQES